MGGEGHSAPASKQAYRQAGPGVGKPVERVAILSYLRALPEALCPGIPPSFSARICCLLTRQRRSQLQPPTGPCSAPNTLSTLDLKLILVLVHQNALGPVLDF